MGQTAELLPLAGGGVRPLGVDAHDAAGRLLHAERSERALDPLAGAAVGRTRAWIGDWRLEGDGDRYRARIEADTFGFDLQLDAAAPPVPNGMRGFSQKAPDPVNASYYYSRPQLAVAGTLRLGDAQHAVQGRAWLDHEWSSELLPAQASGWDWVGINLHDGGAIMAFRMRGRDGEALWTAATVVSAQGETTVPPRERIRFVPLRRWRSPRPIAPEARFADITAGDYVVHLEYGIGRFAGLVVRNIGGMEREYLLMEYANGDTLYVPAHHADRLSKWVGSDERPPNMHRLGERSWTQAKVKAQQAADELADIRGRTGRAAFSRHVAEVTDTLAMAKELFPGKRNSLDMLCDRLEVDNSGRTLHGALLDAELLADVYINMTRGQEALLIEADAGDPHTGTATLVDLSGFDLPVLPASEAEQAAHEQMLTDLDKASGGKTLWPRETASEAVA